MRMLSDVEYVCMNAKKIFYSQKMSEKKSAYVRPFHILGRHDTDALPFFLFGPSWPKIDINAT